MGLLGHWERGFIRGSLGFLLVFPFRSALAAPHDSAPRPRHISSAEGNERKVLLKFITSLSNVPHGVC